MCLFTHTVLGWLQAKGILPQSEPTLGSSKPASSSQGHLNRDANSTPRLMFDRIFNGDPSSSQRRKRSFAESQSQSRAETITIDDSDTERSEDEVELLDADEVEVYKALKVRGLFPTIINLDTGLSCRRS